MGNHHEPLSAMGPVEWDDVPQDKMRDFLDDVVLETQTVIESIPAPAPAATTRVTTAPTSRPRAKTESAAGEIHAASAAASSQRRRATAAAMQHAQDLGKEWKEVKVNARENPLGISVYKLGAKDGRGSWFARRSLHEGLAFDAWKKGLEVEFAETMKVQGSPGSGNIRGIGADKRVEDVAVDGDGHVQVFQLSAQFPGPTAPRDFVTLLLTSESSFGDGPRPLRQYMIVSKPCEHPECPPRQGIIRGYYESVEVIREVPVDPVAARRSLSSADLGRDEARRSAAAKGEYSASAQDPNDFPTAVEWIMVTRSDPGGSVPRFLIEKGTPPGIIGDAGKFLKWITAKSIQGFEPQDVAQDVAEDTKLETGTEANTGQTASAVPDITTTNVDRVLVPNEPDVVDFEHDTVPNSNGLYGMLTGAFGAASSLAATALLRIGGTSSDVSTESLSDVPTMEEHREDQHHDDDDTASEVSSIRSFASALERSVTEEKTPESTTESQSETSRSNPATSQTDKELKKLQERRRKIDDKVAKLHQRMDSKLQGDKEKDAATAAKLREKHDREVAKQEEKYRRELRKLEEKREAERRKAEERRKKAVEREEKANLTLELEKARAERDVAKRQMAMLEAQVGELQAQNTMLVRKLGKLGLMDGSDSSSSLQRSG